ncbi:hypothetical protein [Streptomyces murinus]|uniref:hypothetical protein n=1 Tax=Streptomyces murinus TaxID=33900 RepID=UPI003F47B1C6
MEVEVTRDEQLRALATLEAVVGNEDAALTALAGDAEELPLPALLAAYGKYVFRRVLFVMFGADATMDRDEVGRLIAEINGDPMARVLFLLVDALRDQAALAGNDPSAVKLIGKTTLGVIHAVSDADDQDALALFGAMRDQILESD